MERRRRILVADDDPVARLVVRRRLEAEGYDVALAEIAREPPDLVILDMLMPNVDGMGVVVDLRSRPETARLPVVFISAQGAIVAAAAARVANAFFPKPIDFPALLSQIEGFLSAPPPPVGVPVATPLAPGLGPIGGWGTAPAPAPPNWSPSSGPTSPSAWPRPAGGPSRSRRRPSTEPCRRCSAGRPGGGWTACRWRAPSRWTRGWSATRS